MSLLWSEIPPWDVDRVCPKCNCGASIVDYHSGAEGRRHMKIDTKLCAGLEVEHLHRLCRACSYEWLERTADAAVSESATDGA